MRPLVCYLWAGPTTLLGLAFYPLARFAGGRTRRVDGVLEISGPLIARALALAPYPSASAMTLGHVVLGRDALALKRARAHERIHVRQSERWGPFFLPAYFLASLWVWLNGKNPYWDNPFERAAYAATESQ